MLLDGINAAAPSLPQVQSNRDLNGQLVNIRLGRYVQARTVKKRRTLYALLQPALEGILRAIDNHFPVGVSQF